MLFLFFFLWEVIIQEKLALEKGDEPSTSGLAANSSASNTGSTAATAATGGVSAATAVPNADTAPLSSSAAARRLGIERTGAESDADLVNPQHLQALMDMGFARDQCVEALLFTTSLEQATDYLLSAPPGPARTPLIGLGGVGSATAAATAAIAAAMDTDGNDEDAMMRAIALSLTADSERSDEATASPATGVGTSTSAGSVASTVAEKEPTEHILQGEPLSKQTLDKFVHQALKGCLSLLDSLPETVYRVCSLVVAMVQRNGEAYRDCMLASLAKEIGNCIAAMQVCVNLRSLLHIGV